MKKVLLLGDSIRLGYQPLVKERLRGEAEVTGPEENCRFAKHTLWGVNLWLKEIGTPDVIHWNNGLWDLHHEAPMVEALTALDEYIETLRRIINELHRTGAPIIFATTTPVTPDYVGRSNAEIDLYNTAAVQLMNRHGIEVNDLNALIKQNLRSHLCEDNLHMNEQGSAACAAQVASVIRQYL
ncbi:SGNH/GDSL hydrolase family protein [Paenibacillus sp. FJAT-26967]|uniref:SGNH/GDSL hydrolase family protein n=1 Tax=Paenibacillus sp. FJAT-26967 TaxID=1729690 RepID=UPI00083933CB|nr:SGNH/GDSL hydrolase family protein [Paenibacillus sp. FJAT-26967]